VSKQEAHEMLNWGGGVAAGEVKLGETIGVVVIAELVNNGAVDGGTRKVNSGEAGLGGVDRASEGGGWA